MRLALVGLVLGSVVVGQSWAQDKKPKQPGQLDLNVGGQPVGIRNLGGGKFGGTIAGQKFSAQSLGNNKFRVNVAGQEVEVTRGKNGQFEVTVDGKTQTVSMPGLEALGGLQGLGLEGSSKGGNNSLDLLRQVQSKLGALDSKGGGAKSGLGGLGGLGELPGLLDQIQKATQPASRKGPSPTKARRQNYLPAQKGSDFERYRAFMHQKARELARKKPKGSLPAGQSIQPGKNGQIQEELTSITSMKTDQRDAEGYLRRGEAYWKVGRRLNSQEYFGKALSDLNEAVRLAPRNAEARFQRGKAYFSLGELHEAVTDFNSALTLNPNMANAYYYRGLSYLSANHTEWGNADLERARALDPDLP